MHASATTGAVPGGAGIDQIAAVLARYRPTRLTETLPRAAVLLALSEDEPMNILLTRRAPAMSSHAGQVALPGGRRDADDHHDEATALREAEEEVGLDPARVLTLGRLSEVVSSNGLAVTPVVARIESEPELRPNPAEIARIFHVPAATLAATRPDHVHALRRGEVVRYVPAWYWGNELIWGLTSMILVEFFNLAFEWGFDMKSEPRDIPVRPVP
ncbi:MAG: NUDIX hydrolase [Gammaproteobacteria bacterium]